MATMKVSQTDPDCPNCIGGTTVDLDPGSPVRISVNVVLSATVPYPGEGVSVTNATLRYEIPGHSKTETLGPPNGPDYGNWVAGEQFTVEFDAENWLTDRDFADTGAHMEVTTDDSKVVYQDWQGVQ